MASREEIQERVEVMQAYLDGKCIQVRDIDKDGWKDWTSVAFDSWESMEYRIKPEPREIWVNEYGGGSDVPYRDKETALRGCTTGSGMVRCPRPAVHYREVIEDERG